MNYSDSGLERYILNHTSPQDPILAELERSTWLKTVHPQMITGHLQGMILEMISHMIRPERILEIGTFTGYSTICLAKGLADNGNLITIERDDEITDFAHGFIKKSGLGDQISLLIGDAREIIPTLEDTFDLVYMDADKDEYLEYYKLVFPKLNSGGFIMADNALWGGKVLEVPESGDHFTKGVIAFNRTISEDPLVEQVILPVRDGIMLIRKKLS